MTNHSHKEVIAGQNKYDIASPDDKRPLSMAKHVLVESAHVLQTKMPQWHSVEYGSYLKEDQRIFGIRKIKK